MSADFLPLAELCDALAATSKRLEKRTLIAVYLRRLEVEDAARAALYLAGQPFAETDRRSLNTGGSLLSNALMQLSGADRNAMHATYRRHGDLGAAAFDLLSGRKAAQPPLTLARAEKSFAEIAAVTGPAAKLRLLLTLLEHAAPGEAKYIVKLCTGDMRTGVKQSLIEDAIAAAYEAEPAAVRHALMLIGSLAEVVRMTAAGTLNTATMRLFHPLGFMLASPVDSVQKAIERFAREVAAERVTTLGANNAAALRQAQLEDKYDGMRAQLHCGDRSQPGRVGLFSRNREDIGASFPELIEGFAEISEAAILDGEVLAWLPEERRALPFSSLQQRLGRKVVAAEMRAQTPVIFMAFDLLYLQGELLLDKPLHERRERLEGFAGRNAQTTATPPQRGQAQLFGEVRGATFARMVMAPVIRLQSAAQLDASYEEARARGNEGVMLKAVNSLYLPGRRGLAWLKLKRELATLDVVVTSAEFGHGKRAGVLSDYTFAVRDGSDLKNVGKAYSGLTDVEIAELTAFFKEHTLEDFGGLRTVEPLLVLEVAFNNVMRSERHASGFALRFPRIVRIRADKSVTEIDTLARVEEIYSSQPDRPVE